jgi:hypothetical protein
VGYGQDGASLRAHTMTAWCCIVACMRCCLDGRPGSAGGGLCPRQAGVLEKHASGLALHSLWLLPELLARVLTRKPSHTPRLISVQPTTPWRFLWWRAGSCARLWALAFVDGRHGFPAAFLPGAGTPRALHTHHHPCPSPQIIFYGSFILALKALHLVFGLPDLTSSILSPDIVSVSSSSGWGVIMALSVAAVVRWGWG